MPTDSESAWSTQLAERAPQSAALLQAAAADFRASAARVLAYSDFVLDCLCRDPQLLGQLLERAPAQLAGPLPVPAPQQSEAEFMLALRRWRRAEFARIAWRDLAGWASLAETIAELSLAADAAIAVAEQQASRILQLRYGVPRSEAGAAQNLIVVAMGKLGGGELNFSSDIDLVFLFPEHGVTDGERSLSNIEYFVRLGQLLIRLLDQITIDGRVFRVDMRLRPFGESGPLVASFAALEDYLQLQGRDWERYAWVKARAVTGQREYQRLYATVIAPFVYRRYLDFGVFESLREMKALIEREVVRRDLQENIKLGPGGIREIEFIVQSFQLIRGGQERRLQNCSFLKTLPLLAGSKLLPLLAAADLAVAYEFLRRLENHLQMYADEQTHQLPEAAPARARLAASMGFGSWEQLHQSLQQQRQSVSRHFAEVVFGQASEGTAPTTELARLWEPPLDRELLEARLGALAIAPAAPVAQLLIDLSSGALWRRLDEPGRRRLGALVPLLVVAAARHPQPLEVLRRLVRVLEAIGPRSTYFALLRENAAARERLVDLSGHGDFLTGQIAAHPLLLDELIDQRLLELLPDRASLAEDLEQRLADVAGEGEEQQVERLVHFQRAAMFRVALADLGGRLNVMAVSDRLTDIAELILEQALRLSWAHLTPLLGTPMCGSADERRVVRICAVGYGKLGGIELGYSSDLDLVFLHDSAGEAQVTSGARSIDNQLFFVRYAQRVVHLLSTHSAAGRLYEIDMRLRPSGKGGMLITNIDSFADYQRREAWSWEHQALLHARAVAGDMALRSRFEQDRLEILERAVHRESLQQDVQQMRQRMRDELSRAGRGQLDLKQDPGGMADIEFLAQYWALRWAGEHPPVVWFSDTIRQLESVASADLVPQRVVDVLTGAYRAYRACIHRRALDGQGPVVDEAEFAAERAAVISIWDQAMGI
jgi:[glutamine synthetase] adenylyltransferase / [glutamine synthetase]-adenylyl-L-tyrosine phosphorylase